MPWAEATDMEDRIEVQVGRELETIVEVSDPFKGFIRAKLLESELRRFLMDLDILSRKPDYVSDFKNVGCIFVLFKLFLYLFLG
jgi:hypothetical protein